MGMGRLSLIVVAACAFARTPCVCAQPVDGAQAERAARAWLVRGGVPAALAGRSVSAVATLSDGAARMHIAKLAGGGYVVLSTDDLVAPVIAFAASGDAPAQDARNPLWALLTQDLACRAAATNAAAATASLRALAAASPSRTAEQQRWDELLGTSKGLLRAPAASVSDPRVDPLVSTRWGQTTVGGKNVYNYYTPGNYPCGCVATVTAQIMKYHEYPKVKVSNADYACTVDGVTNNFAMIGGVYDWSNMPDVPTADITDTQARAIGKLTYDIGCSVGMAWRAESSGASVYSARLSLMSLFRYASCEGVCFTDRYATNPYGYTLARCQQIVIPCLDYGAPVIMNVNGPAGGHAVVVDGYGYTGNDFYMHLNCGWDGANDAWYCPPDLTMGSYTFTAIDGFLYNILPQATGTLVSGRVLDEDGAPVEDVTVALRLSGVVKATASTNARGIYAVLAPKEGSYALVAASGGTAVTQNVSVVANNSRQMAPDGGYYVDAGYVPTIGNSYANDFRLAARHATATTSDVPVPYAWLDAFYPGAGTSAASYERLGNARAANGWDVWQCYLAGLDPTNAESRLVALIQMKDGVPHVSWTPVSAVSDDLGYVYRVKGKTTLADGSWSATNAATRFFKVFLEKK